MSSDAIRIPGAPLPPGQPIGKPARQRLPNPSTQRRLVIRPPPASWVYALASSALALPGIAGAESPEGRYTSSYSYSRYFEDDLPAGRLASGSTQRYEIDSHQFHLGGPVTSRSGLGIDVVYESMSGATPWYVERGPGGRRRGPGRRAGDRPNATARGPGGRYADPGPPGL